VPDFSQKFSCLLSVTLTHASICCVEVTPFTLYPERTIYEITGPKRLNSV
jgi:hypothetical protein